MNKLMNSAMMPGAGLYSLRSVSRERFAQELRANPFESYVGYPETAQLIESFSGVSVPVSRAQTQVVSGDTLLICKLKYRPQDPGQKGKLAPGADDFEFFVCHYSAE